MPEFDSLVDKITYYAFTHDSDFTAYDWIYWTRDHAELPVLAISIYLAIITQVPRCMRDMEPFNLKATFAAWNLFLSIFSMLGCYHLLPMLAKQIFEYGYLDSVCSEPKYLTGAPGLYLTIFIYSKFPELLDTVFLILRKKPVIFLHWFHHVTVLLYCWHSFHLRINPGMWFAAMNYTVHSVMYFYYFLTNIGLYKLVAPFAPLITTIQILQMTMGMTVLITAAYQQEVLGVDCGTDPANWKLGLAMYTSYFVLFSMLFIQKYLRGNVQATRENGCITRADAKALDAAGFFHKHPTTSRANDNKSNTNRSNKKRN